MSAESVVTVAPEIEQEAREQGWVPLTEFRDAEHKWVDAETFVKRGREINPILRKNNEALRKELDKANKKADEAISAAKEFREYQQELSKKRVKDLEDQIAQLKAEKRAAISQGDGDRAVAIDDAIDTIKDERDAAKKATEAPTSKQPSTAAESVIDTTLQAWIEKNTWYGKEDASSMELTEMANGIATTLRRQNPTLVGQAFLDKLDERLEDRGIKAKRTKPDPIVEGTSQVRPGDTSSGRKYADLPADAKAACDKFVKQGLMTREQYLADYAW